MSRGSSSISATPSEPRWKTNSIFARGTAAGAVDGANFLALSPTVLLAVQLVVHRELAHRALRLHLDLRSDGGGGDVRRCRRFYPQSRVAQREAQVRLRDTLPAARATRKARLRGIATCRTAASASGSWRAAAAHGCGWCRRRCSSRAHSSRRYRAAVDRRPRAATCAHTVGCRLSQRGATVTTGGCAAGAASG
eukprot:1715849-Prymnesium_polylepis.2